MVISTQVLFYFHWTAGISWKIFPVSVSRVIENVWLAVEKFVKTEQIMMGIRRMFELKVDFIDTARCFMQPLKLYQ